MKSRDRSSHGRVEIGSGVYIPCVGVPILVLWQTEQCLTNFLTSFRNPGQKNRSSSSWCVLLIPTCSPILLLCNSLISFIRRWDLGMQSQWSLKMNPFFRRNPWNWIPVCIFFHIEPKSSSVSYSFLIFSISGIWILMYAIVSFLRLSASSTLLAWPGLCKMVNVYLCKNVIHLRCMWFMVVAALTSFKARWSDRTMKSHCNK